MSYLSLSSTSFYLIEKNEKKNPQLLISTPSMASANPILVNLPIPKRLSLSPKPMVIITSAHINNSNWASISDEIDAHLKQSIPFRPPLSVFEPMHHLTFAAPRTTAPALCVATCELVGGDRDQAIVAASAFRVLLAAAFTHDQLLMTGRPGTNIELLTGDGLVSFGLELLGSLDDPARNNSDRVLRVIGEVTRALGSQGIVYGQSNELRYSRFDGDEAMKKEFWIDHVCKKKEGELHECAGACGAIIGGGREEEIEKLRRYGFYVGMLHGVLNWSERHGTFLAEDINDLRELALKELESFNQEKVQEISSFLEIDV